MNKKKCQKIVDLSASIKTVEGVFSRSKFLIIRPKYIIRNDSSYNIVIQQSGVKFEKPYFLGPKQNSNFFWSQNKAKKYLIMGINSQDRFEAKKQAWSSKFQIDKVQELALKLLVGYTELKEPQFVFQRVSINTQDNLIVIRIMDEDQENPPFLIENQTQYDVYYKQYIQKKVKSGCCFSKAANKIKSAKIPIYPDSKQRFTWDEWVTEPYNHILEVEIDGKVQYYDIDKIADYKPIIIKQNTDLKQNINKKYLYKKGYLVYTSKEQEIDHQQVYCIIDTYKQKFKVYDKHNYEMVINLKGAKILETKNCEFIISNSKGRDLHLFEVENQTATKEWIDHIWRTILINQPEMVHFKIEPMNQTKKLVFYV